MQTFFQLVVNKFTCDSFLIPLFLEAHPAHYTLVAFILIKNKNVRCILSSLFTPKIMFWAIFGRTFWVAEYSVHP